MPKAKGDDKFWDRWWCILHQDPSRTRYGVRWNQLVTDRKYTTNTGGTTGWLLFEVAVHADNTEPVPITFSASQRVHKCSAWPCGCLWGGAKYNFGAQPKPAYHVLEVADPFVDGAPADGAAAVVATPVHGAPPAVDVAVPSICTALADGGGDVAADIGAGLAAAAAEVGLGAAFSNALEALAAPAEGGPAPGEAAGAPLSENDQPPLPAPSEDPPHDGPPPLKKQKTMEWPQVPVVDAKEYLTVPAVDKLKELDIWPDNGMPVADAKSLPPPGDWEIVPVPEPVWDRPAERAIEEIHRTLIHLARQIGDPRQYVGFSAFVLFALEFECRPALWVGEQKWDIVEAFVPEQFRDSCKNPCVVDGVCLALGLARGVLQPEWVPISPANPLWQCKHYMALSRLGKDIGVAQTELERFYAERGLTVLGTFSQGDCGIDVMCQMLMLPQCDGGVLAVRRRLKAYLLQHATEPWMWDLMASCGEVEQRLVNLCMEESNSMPDCTALAEIGGGPPDDPDGSIGTALAALPDEVVCDEEVEAIAWASKQWNNRAVVHNLLHELPPVIISDWVVQYREHVRQQARGGQAPRPRLSCYRSGRRGMSFPPFL